MTFFEAFEKIQKSVKFESVEMAEHFAIQLNITDEDAQGICYIEVCDGKVSIEPYDYVDNDGILWASADDFAKIFSGRLGVEKALEQDRLKITGDKGRAMEFTVLVKKIQRNCKKKA